MTIGRQVLAHGLRELLQALLGGADQSRDFGAILGVERAMGYRGQVPQAAIQTAAKCRQILEARRLRRGIDLKPMLGGFLAQDSDHVGDFAAVFLFDGDGLAVVFNGVVRDGGGDFAEGLGGDADDFGEREVGCAEFFELRNDAVGLGAADADVANAELVPGHTGVLILLALAEIFQARGVGDGTLAGHESEGLAPSDPRSDFKQRLTGVVELHGFPPKPPRFAGGFVDVKTVVRLFPIKLIGFSQGHSHALVTAIQLSACSSCPLCLMMARGLAATGVLDGIFVAKCLRKHDEKYREEV